MNGLKIYKMRYLLWGSGFLFSLLLTIYHLIEGDESALPWLVATIYSLLLIMQEVRIDLLSDKNIKNNDILDNDL